MSRYLIVSRLRWPALLLLTGVIALLDEMDILSWGHAWPLYLILLGVLALAERAALASEVAPPAGYPYGTDYQAAGYAPGYASGYPPPAGAYTAPATPAQPVSTSIVPSQTDLELHEEDAAKTSRKSWEEEGR
jgi:hypothetical protein